MEEAECIRPFPERLSSIACQFRLCRYYPECNPNCTYAHSQRELDCWNATLREKRRKRRGASPGGSTPKKPRRSETGAVSSTVARSISLCHHEEQIQGQMFVETEVYKCLTDTVREMETKKKKSLLLIFGPKGTGKTCALLKLKDSLGDGAQYVDLADYSHQFSVDVDSNYLLIDNAQLFERTTEVEGLRSKIVIAAFSPGAKLRENYGALTKRCGDGSEKYFFWRPFTFDEVKDLAKKHNVSISRKTNWKKREISETKFKKIFCWANGNPRYIREYFRDFDMSYMLNVLGDQFQSMLKDTTNRGDTLCKALINVLQTGSCNIANSPAYVGAAYCTTTNGIGPWRLAHSYYGLRAIADQGIHACGERWQQLENMTVLMLSTSNVTVLGKDGSQMCLYRASSTMHQENIGDKPDKKIIDNRSTLFKLAPKHNVVDSILYDCRGDPSKVYFIQTSSLPYSKKKKKKKCLEEPVKKDSIDVSNGQSILDHYTTFLGQTRSYYIYATINSTRSKDDSVFFLDLLKFCPESCSNYTMDDSDDSSTTD